MDEAGPLENLDIIFYVGTIGTYLRGGAMHHDAEV